MEIVPAPGVARLLYSDAARIHCQSRARGYALGCHIAALIFGLPKMHILCPVLQRYATLMLDVPVRMKGFEQWLKVIALLSRDQTHAI
jgi:hypothetical protein